MNKWLDKFHLDKSVKKHQCPQCGQKTFVLYLNTDSGEPADEYQYGRCDREAKCSYHVKPVIERQKGGTQAVIKNIYPDEALFKKLNREATNLHKILEQKLKMPLSFMYECGVLEDKGKTVYVHRNFQGALVNLKWLSYKEDGHRQDIKVGNHELPSFSLKQPEQKNAYIKEQYTFCLFMEHLLDPEKKKPVCVVESEKTALICKFVYPDFDWVACGSANGLSDGSEGTANKIPALKGRVVYWLCDADVAGRGKHNDKQEWVWPSSVRNLIKHIDEVNVVDFFPTRNDGSDLGDYIMDGLKPEIKPTWSKKSFTKELHDKRQKSLVINDRDLMLKEFREGKPVGDTARIEIMKENFSWMRTFVNCWTGWPNDGKTTFFQFMALIKAITDGWKFLIWSPEMINTRETPTGIKYSSVDIMDELVFMYTGKTPYKHYKALYGIEQMPEQEYLAALDFLEQYFIIIQPQDRKYTDLLDNFYYFHEIHGVDAFLIDPFKNLEQDQDSRTDLYLDKVFTDFKICSQKTNTSFNIIAHPKQQVDPKNSDGSYKFCTQHMLNGGASWNNNMDGIYSIYRPMKHKSPTDPQTNFISLKQRKQQLVGRTGICKDIEFEFRTNRYYFNGVCPIDGSQQAGKPKAIHEAKPTQAPIHFGPVTFNEPQTFADDDTPF